MAPFTALLALELHAPLGIQKFRRATEQLAVRHLPLAVKTANVRALLPGETCQSAPNALSFLKHLPRPHS